ncbi:MAG: hypothetical protein ACM3X0_05760 [Bacteroidota bacterium]
MIDSEMFRWFLVVIELAVATIVFMLKNDKRWSPWLLTALALLYVFCVASFRVFSSHSVSDSFQMVTHLDAIMYSVSQVATGKSVLVNLPAQYGLYAELLNPVFQAIGLSVLNFTLVMATLQIFALILILRVIFHVVKLNVLRVVGACALVTLAGYTWAAPLDAYFQYYPIRFFFPAVSVALYWSYLIRPSQYKVIVLGIISSLAIPFNLDSGIPVMGSCIAGFLFAALFSPVTQRAEKIRSLKLFSAAALLMAATFIGLIQIKGGAPRWAEMVKYQNIFYITGAYMLPMARSLHFWMLVAGVYVFGIVSYLGFSLRKAPSRIWELVFQISVLGLGLFSYYQGRSHIIVLMLASWPAILIIFILTDRTFRASNARVLPSIWRLFAYPSVVLGAFLCTLLTFKLPILATTLVTRLMDLTQLRSTELTRNIEFIKSGITNNKSMVIIAPHQAIYYAETGTSSSVDGPGISENLLLEDRVAFVNEVVNGTVKDVFYQPDKTYLEEEYVKILDGPFDEVGKSQDGMMHLQRRATKFP